MLQTVIAGCSDPGLRRLLLYLSQDELDHMRGVTPEMAPVFRAWSATLGMTQRGWLWCQQAQARLLFTWWYHCYAQEMEQGGMPVQSLLYRTWQRQMTAMQLLKTRRMVSGVFSGLPGRDHIVPAYLKMAFPSSASITVIHRGALALITRLARWAERVLRRPGARFGEDIRLACVSAVLGSASVLIGLGSWVIVGGRTDAQ